MILTCPHCSTRFLVDPAKLGQEGRRVRCQKCGHRWHAAPPADAPRRVVPPAPPPPIPPAPSRGRSAHGGGTAALLGWLGLALVVLVLAGAVVGRNEVVASFPHAAPFYQKLGLPVTVRLGLEFREVTSLRLVEGGVAVLVVEGEIVNVSEQPRPVPSVRIALLDDNRREIEARDTRPASLELAAGGTTQFQIRMVGPPEEARNFSVTFAP
jgi:predicted Zn finger-like uncharacterized protein